MPAAGRIITKRLLIDLTVAATLVVAVGCQKPALINDYEAFLDQPGGTVSASDYRLAPPDQIEIGSHVVQELNEYKDVIRPDGKITLPLIGTVFVAGMTCEQAAAVIEKSARKFYNDAELTLRVVGFNSKKVYVFGEVASPGPYAYDGANTILETLAAAQPTRLSDPARIQVLRPTDDGTPAARMTVSLDRMVKHGDVTLNAILEEGDIIYVPANGLASVGLAFQQLLLPLQPAAATVRAPADIEDTAIGTTYGRDER